jgi:hypothetical protein
VNRLLGVLLICLGLALGASPATAGTGAPDQGVAELQKKKPKKKKKPGKKGKKRKKKAGKKGAKKIKKAPPPRAGKTSIPVQIGIGPAIHMITGPVQRDQLFHYGLKTYTSAIIDNETIRANKNMIPKKFRSSIMKAREIRISPMILALIPDTIFISPKIGKGNTQMYGAVFRPIAFGISPLSNDWFRFDINAGLLAMYAYLESDNPKIGENHLLDIGLDAKAAFEFKLHRSFLITLGWASQFYIPMELGGKFWKVGTKNAFWHVGQAFLLFNFRFPYNHKF